MNKVLGMLEMKFVIVEFKEISKANEVFIGEPGHMPSGLPSFVVENNGSIEFSLLTSMLSSPLFGKFTSRNESSSRSRVIFARLGRLILAFLIHLAAHTNNKPRL